MIITLTPFPSIEYIYCIKEMVPQKVLETKNTSLNILSKGIYSAQIMKVLQEEPVIISSLGGFAGKSIKYYLDKAKIKTDIVWTDYETPHRVRIMAGQDHEKYLLQNREDMPVQHEISKMSYKLKQHIKKVSTLILSGHLPEGQDISVYKEWVTLAKYHNVKVIASTGQKEVWEILKEEKPYALFFTEDQLKCIGYEYHNDEDIIKEMMPYLGDGLHYICVYLKSRAALVMAKNKCCKVQKALHMVSQDNTATSGAFLGALAIGINRKYEQEKMAKLCLAAALSADDNIMHKICNRKEIETAYKKTKVSIMNA